MKKTMPTQDPNLPIKYASPNSLFGGMAGSYPCSGYDMQAKFFLAKWVRLEANDSGGGPTRMMGQSMPWSDLTTARHFWPYRPRESHSFGEIAYT